MKYKIVSDDGTDQLARKVNKYLSEGWHLFGTPFVVGHPFVPCVNQALTFGEVTPHLTPITTGPITPLG